MHGRERRIEVGRHFGRRGVFELDLLVAVADEADKALEGDKSVSLRANKPPQLTSQKMLTSNFLLSLGSIRIGCSSYPDSRRSYDA